MTSLPHEVTHTVSAISVVDLARALVELGCIEHTFIQALGPECLRYYRAWTSGEAIQEKRLPEALMVRLWQAADAHAAKPDIGLTIGARVNHDAKGLLANWLFQCESLDEAFHTFANNVHLLNPKERWTREDQADRVILSVEFLSTAYPSIAVDRSLAAAVSWVSTLVGSKLTPISVSFSRKRPADLRPYYDIFGTKLVFGQHRNAMTLAKSVFQQPFNTSNPYLKELLEKQAQKLSDTLRRNTPLSDKINALLREDLPRYCDCDAVCRAVHLSRSTLYRKLKAEGLSYTQLVREARKEMLHTLSLRGDNDHEISDALGFRDNSSLYRFKKMIK